jgi:hypothetical protein
VVDREGNGSNLWVGLRWDAYPKTENYPLLDMLYSKTGFRVTVSGGQLPGLIVITLDLVLLNPLGVSVAVNLTV